MINARIRKLYLRDEVCLSMPTGRDPHMAYMIARFDGLAGQWDAVDRARREGRSMPVFSFAV